MASCKNASMRHVSLVFALTTLKIGRAAIVGAGANMFGIVQQALHTHTWGEGWVKGWRLFLEFPFFLFIQSPKQKATATKVKVATCVRACVNKGQQTPYGPLTACYYIYTPMPNVKSTAVHFSRLKHILLWRNGFRIHCNSWLEGKPELEKMWPLLEKRSIRLQSSV